MLMRIKIGFVGVIYFLGGLFMVIFPPKSFPATSSKGARDVKVKAADGGNLNFSAMNYLTSPEVADMVVTIARQDPDLVTTFALAPVTSENKTIPVMEIRNDEGLTKKGILVIGALDPMVWGAPSAVLDLAQQLLYSSYNHAPFLTDYDWYMIPLANPEGLDFTLSVRDIPVSPDARWRRNMTGATTRPAEWRKNLEGHTDSEDCFGTDINRNFAYHWQDAEQGHAPAQPCSQRYPGPRPFSAAETRAVRRYVDRMGSSVQLAVVLDATFEPRKESIVYPWRYSERKSEGWRQLQAIGEAAAREARLPTGRLFEVHQSSADGKVGGSLEDYLMGVVNTKLVYAVRPYHDPMPNTTIGRTLDEYVKQAINATLSLVWAWRVLSQVHTVPLFGEERRH